ncbi:Pimeloyl-ACP methyl ester carboxylesterase [Flavobacterium sp. CF108]|uniref:alpha/beta fold hydrolase n=1 Tax=unclassified Flavobacterium TaxID=196869 RepID=UPI0008D4D862|nr:MULTISPECIES: alpha/beta hydrolase [unclassified Flavobacterium]SEO44060.1 Pimeloyl-ACP methyl ester carboxylesterase [Flavobacterium sp. fv08]SHH69063.1 Pimeloyl-ACP methyl ester carboxylesterase [Flavobacterium sp. CF108]
MLIDINGSNLYVEFHNNFENRPVIVFLHDSLGCVELWRDFPKQLAEISKCNVLIYDRLGYGKSDSMNTYIRPVNYLELEADILNDLLETLKIENAVLFGHSDGGSIALIAASKYKNRVKALICEAAHIFVEDITLQGIREAVHTYETTNLPLRLGKYHGKKTETIFKAWTETWLRNDFRDWNIEYLLPKIDSPLLFIQGESDEYGTLEQVNKTINLAGGKSEKYIIPETGHTPHKEAAELVINKVTLFIKNSY